MRNSQLECFMTVASAGSFVAAADQLYVTQSAVSKQIRLLEESWGVTLFIRGPRNVELTESGKIMLEAVRNYTAGMNAAIERAQNAEHNPGSQQLHVGVFDGFRGEHFSQSLSRFHTEHPSVTLSLREQQFSYLNDGLRRGKYDVILTMECMVKQSDFIYMPFLTVEYFALISSSHPLARKPGFTVSDLSDETFYIPSPDDSDATLQNALNICKESGIIMKNHVRVPNINSAIMCIELNNGVVILDTSVLSINLDSENYVKIPLDAPSEKLVLCWKKNDKNPLIQSLARRLCSEAGDAVSG